VERGTHDELLAREGVYERMVRLQTGREPEPPVAVAGRR
jgi:hypothetical protein